MSQLKNTLPIFADNRSEANHETADSKGDRVWKQPVTLFYFYGFIPNATNDSNFNSSGKILEDLDL